MIEQKNPRWMVVLALALGVLLPSLAVLQYRWLGRLSEGEGVRMRATLQAAVERFGEDVERELARATSAFALAPTPSPEQAASHLAHAWREWEAGPFPDLIEAVYWVEPAGDAPILYRFDLGSETLEATPWPEDLAGWQEYLERVVARDRPPGAQGAGTLAHPPALIVPVPSSFEEAAPGRTVIRFGEGAGSVILVIDESTLAEALFPALSEAYFSRSEDLAYDVAVVRRAMPSEALYASDPQLPLAAFAHADASADFGRLGWDPLRDALRSPLPSRDEGLAVGPARGASTPGGEHRSFRIVDVRSHGSLSAGAYRLLVRHRAGSLEAAVAAARRRNLGVSLGILSVLGAVVALFFVAGSRAHQLAAQQAAFVAGISHELRTPLTVIRVAGENLADGTVADPERARAYGRIVRDEGVRLTGLVDQVLELAAARANSPDRLPLAPTHVGEVVDRAIVGCRPYLDREGVEVETSIQPGLPPVLADGEALSGALRNLLVNAVKYGGSARSIWIDAEAGRGGRTVCLAVRDEGVGIPPDELPRIFEPFYRGRRAREEQVHGSGLGLSLVRRIAELHGGSVTAESEPGRGSVFTLSIPAAGPLS